MKDPRPRCGHGCPHYVTGNEANGTCRHDPPTFDQVYISIRQPTADTPDAAPVKRFSGPHGKWPVVSADAGCCSLHPKFPAYAASLVSAKVVDDTDVF